MKKINKIGLLSLICFMVVASTGCSSKLIDEVKNSTENVLDNNNNYYFELKNTKFNVGDKINKLSNVDYNLRENEVSETAPANKYVIGAGHIVNKEGRTVFQVTPYNTTNNDIKILDAVIGGFDISLSTASSDDIAKNITVYGGIKLGSTKDEVEKAFGEPSSINDSSSDYIIYNYQSSKTYRNYKFTFDANDTVKSIYWQNLVFND